MQTPIQLPQWKCHKVVKASKIHKITPGHDTVSLNLDSGILILPDSYLNKHSPEVGGYYVEYDTGYCSYSPAASFEAGYKPLGQSNEEKLRAALILHIGYSDVDELKALRDVCAGMPGAPPEDVEITLAAIDALIETAPAA